MKYVKHPVGTTFKDLTGKTFGRLVVRGYMGKAKKSTSWHCVCECGKGSIVAGNSLTRGHTKSCGCLSIEGLVSRSTKHGMTDTSTYRSFVEAKRRCGKGRDFNKYGARGVKFLYKSFEHFFNDLGPRPPKHSLDRIDNDGNYEPGNCRWATRLQQCANRRGNVKITIKGHKRNISQWGSEANSSSRIKQRLGKSKWPPAVAVFGVVPKGVLKKHYRKAAEQSIKGKTLQQLADAVKLDYPLGHKF